ncbi:AMP-binding protein [Actinokineospora sp. PR83]|uniref:AMP-binding protein n=1 Tax=Actinokineospora sp. PR83 TaxID=2884908 RepID=UPI001F280A8A|nr:AMP-binding protein [Actinokineospora sp. PR83]MCG8917182.1 AMP-binding protein [Actinokineospora sp. PR83]
MDLHGFFAELMDWHFAPETGSPFWLERLPGLGFDPRTDVRTHEDLRLFPNVVDELRAVPVADLVPRGYRGDLDVIGAYDSGGTTGDPKRLLLHADWFASYLPWVGERMDALGFPEAGNWLALAPSGPHVFGRVVADLVRRRKGILFTIDLDPRWVRRCLAEGRTEEAELYTEHLLDQAEAILTGQRVDVLVATPPLLERLSLRPALVEAVTANVRTILWGGASLDPDTRQLLREEVLPTVGLFGMYGSTTILGGAMERPAAPGDPVCVFDPFAPQMTFSVVDPATGEDVAEGERGQVVMHHVSRSLLLPNNLERDLATRIAAPPGVPGCSVADVAPVAAFQDTKVIEGVY